MPENPNISYFLDFFKSYILFEVDLDHWYDLQAHTPIDDMGNNVFTRFVDD